LIDLKFLEQVNLIIKSGCPMRDIAYCLHDDDDRCSCRKPEPGLIIRMIEKHSLLKSETIMAGDTWKDVAAGRAAGIKTVLLRREYNRDAKCRPDYEVDELMDLWEMGIL